MLEVLDLRHNPPVSTIFRWSQTEYALDKVGGVHVNLGYTSLLLAVMGVFTSMFGDPSVMRGNRKLLSELPPVVKRTLGRLPTTTSSLKPYRDLVNFPRLVDLLSSISGGTVFSGHNAAHLAY